MEEVVEGLGSVEGEVVFEELRLQAVLDLGLVLGVESHLLPQRVGEVPGGLPDGPIGEAFPAEESRKHVLVGIEQDCDLKPLTAINNVLELLKVGVVVLFADRFKAFPSDM